MIPGLGRSPGEQNGYPLQYPGLEDSMDCIVHGVAKNQRRLSDFHFDIYKWNYIFIYIYDIHNIVRYYITYIIYIFYIYTLYIHKKLALQLCSLRNLTIYLPETRESGWQLFGESEGWRVRFGQGQEQRCRSSARESIYPSQPPLHLCSDCFQCLGDAPTRRGRGSLCSARFKR